MVDPVLPGGNAKFLLKCPVKGGIIHKANSLRNGFQGLVPFNQPLGGNEPGLGDTAVET